MSSYYLIGIIAFALIIYYFAKQISFANLLKEGEKITSTALGGFETIIKFLTIVLTIAVATYALQKLLGIEVIKSPWYWILIAAVAVIFLTNWLQKKANIDIAKSIATATSIIALLMLITWAIWPGTNIKKVVDGIREKPELTCPVKVKQEILFNKNEEVSSISVLDKSTVWFSSNKAFHVVERYGMNDDGTEKLTNIKMPPGESKRYFAWGGTVRVAGIYDGTKLIITY